jgi:4-amino-4-deoxy-L-arabinose transferase-like glycosyltransferase
MLLWGGWLLVTGAAISLGKGIIHPYYTVALAPAIGAIVGIGATALWRRRSDDNARLFLAAAVGATAWWSAQLLDRTPAWHPMLRHVVLVGGLALAGIIAAWPAVLRWVGGAPSAATVVASLALVATLAGPAAYALSTAAQPHSGAIPSAGPAGSGGFGPGGRGGPGGGGGGGILGSSSSNPALTAALQTDPGRYTWAAAAISANQAAGYQLASGQPVMAIGGFNGTDPSPTLAQFQDDVGQGRIHYFIGGGGLGGGRGGVGGGARGGGNGSGTSAQISAWVQQTFTATTIGGTTVYDLTTGS